MHEDDDLLVVNKPVGLLTSTVPRERRATLLKLVRDYIAKREPRARVGLIHRLDKDASGLLVFSKNDAAYRSLKQQFFEHSVDRIYLAVTDGVPQPLRGTIRSKLIEWTDGSVHTTRAAGKGEVAVTDYQVIRQDPRHALVRVTLQTGRKHQIRVHLAERGAPIVGDRVYGNAKAGDASGQTLMLAAVELGLTHPRTKKRLYVKIPMPEPMARVCRQMT